MDKQENIKKVAEGEMITVSESQGQVPDPPFNNINVRWSGLLLLPFSPKSISFPS
jgi:hypothetical protein